MKHSPDSRLSVTGAIEATAAAWLAQRDDGFAPKQAEEFACWRSADVRHEAAVARLEATWSALQHLREYRPEAARHPDRDLLRASRQGRRLRPLLILAAGAALAASIVLGAIWWAGGVARHSHATTFDGYERVTLDDGSVVELNSASEVRIQFSAAERRVCLVRGEAHFTVAKNPARPFWVEAGTVAVRAVGTAFNVRLGTQEVEVLVTEGRVAVAAPDARSRMPEARGEGVENGPEPAGPKHAARPTELGANERIVVRAVRSRAAAVVVSPPVVEKVSPEIVREALAWQGPRLVFADTPLAEVIAQFNRRNPVQLELADAELGTLPIGGSFRAENVDAFVRLLDSGGEVAVERPSSTRIVLRKIGPGARPD